MVVRLQLLLLIVFQMGLTEAHSFSLQPAWAQELTTERDNLVFSLVNNTSSLISEGPVEDSTNIHVHVHIKEDWRVVFDWCKIIVMSVGLIANALTLVVLYKNGKAFSPVITLLFKHQSFMDALVCIFTIIMLVQPPMWTAGKNTFSFLLCQLWHSQALFWGFWYLSVYNLAVISLERYIAVCRPFAHADFTPGKACKYLLALYLLLPLQVFLGALQVRYVDGECVSEYYFQTQFFKTLMTGYAVYCVATYYALPCIIFFVMYGLVIFSLLTRRGKQDQLGKSRVIDKAATQLTKTAIIVTVFFIVTVGIDSCYYMLGYSGVVSYIMNSAIQKVTLFIASLNSCCNPFIYALYMPAYRHAIKKTIRCSTTTGSLK